MRSGFENSIKRSASYEKLVYQHGERLFIFDDGKYNIAAVQIAWEIFKEKQTEVDELQCEVKRINLWYSNVKLQLENKEIDSAIDAKKIDEMQRRNQMLNDNIKEQGQKLVYQNEVIETQAEKLLCLRDEKAELQKRIDAALEIISCLTDEYTKSELRKALRGQK